MNEKQERVAELISEMIDGEGGYSTMKWNQHTTRHRKFMLEIARAVLELIREVDNEVVGR